MSTAKSSQKEQKFGFPFEPYDIQLSFMNSAYQVMDSSKIGIFESPTGTGKSLSLLCSTLQWLDDHSSMGLDRNLKSLDRVLTDKEDLHGKMVEEKLEKEEENPNNLPAWMIQQAKQQKEMHAKAAQEEYRKKREKKDKKLAELREQLKKEEEFDRPSKRRKNEGINEILGKKPDEWEEFLLDSNAIDSDEEEDNPKVTLKQKKEASQLRKNKRKLEELARSLYNDSSDEEGEGFVQFMRSIDPNYQKSEREEDEVEIRKIFYCSRTHSQLSQFVNEIKKTKWGRDTKVISLGSRQNLCVNEDVLKLKSLNRINDKCLDMQKSEKGEKDSSCRFYDQQLNKDFANFALSKVQDIEELVSLGRKKGMCPYYGTRSGIKSSQLVALPYNTLLHKNTRESLGISVKDHVVVIDEAHNLIEAINGMYSVQISLAQLSLACSQLSQYKEKYEKRLAPKNLEFVKQILNCMQQFIKFLSKPPSVSSPTDEENSIHSEVITINDLLFRCKIDDINPYKLETYFEKSEIVKKVNGFHEKVSSVEIKEKAESGVDEHYDRHRPALGVLESFLMALTNVDKDGRIVVQFDLKAPKLSQLRFILLNPENHFLDILKDARSIILAGGTMQPVSDFVNQLISDRVPSDKIEYFSCGHIIPKENLVAYSLSSGPSGKAFDFTYKSRNDPKLIEELGNTIVNLVSIVPDGVVLFFPSYAYEEKVYQHWKTCGILQRIENKKKFVREPRNAETKLEDCLREYSKSIEFNYDRPSTTATPALKRQTGAILSCIVGGKLSEGINFGDGLGRCVVMVGLPYPNQNDPVLIEKMKYISQLGKDKTAGSEYYENICMKAVNQSIGRSIRHKNDYSTILLVDERYSNGRITKKLPGWIGSSLQTNQKFTDMFGSVGKFFASKKENQKKLEEMRYAAASLKRMN